MIDEKSCVDTRCGHNYEIANCPYANCEAKRLLDENEALRLWSGCRIDVECIGCGRRPIYGISETIGEPGKALCKDCMATRDIVRLKRKLAAAQSERDRLRSQINRLEKQSVEDSWRLNPERMGR